VSSSLHDNSEADVLLINWPNINFDSKSNRTEYNVRKKMAKRCREDWEVSDYIITFEMVFGLLVLEGSFW
jgi:hypothetical protein